MIEKCNSLDKLPRIVAPALWLAVAFAFGILVADYLQISPAVVPVITVLAILLVVLSFTVGTRWHTFIILTLFFAAGAARYGNYKIIPKDHWRKTEGIQIVRGMICDFPEFSGGRWRATMKIMSLSNGSGFQPASGKARLYIDAPEKSLFYGQVWQIRRAPYSPSDRGNFFVPKYSRILRRSGIYGTIWCDGRDATLLDEDRGSPVIRNLIAVFRRHIGECIAESLPEKHGALLEGMLLGGGRKLPLEVRDYFSNTGVIHILAVSGLHVGIIAGALWYILRKMAKSNSVVAAAITILLLVFYAFLVQLRPSVLRATTMAVFVLLAPLVHRRANPINLLGAAALCILIIRPADIFSVGFQLSFAATGGILYFLPRMAVYFGENFLLRKGKLYYVAQLLLVTVAVQIGVAPISAFHFHKFQLIAPIANLLIVPVVGYTIMAGFAGTIIHIIIPTAGNIIMRAEWLPLSYILIMVKFLSNLPFAFVPVAHPAKLAIAGYYTLVFGSVNIRFSSMARVAVLAGIAMIAIPFGFGKTCADAVFFNVRGGCAYFAGRDGKTALICDCSPKDIRNIVFPFILATGRKDVDALCLPLTSGNLQNMEQLTRAIEHSVLLIPDKFPDSNMVHIAVRDSIDMRSLKLRFISPKNCKVELCGRDCLFLHAPVMELSPCGITFINFPAELVDERLFNDGFAGMDALEAADVLLLGKNAGAWREKCGSKKIPYIDINQSAAWIKMKSSSDMEIISAQ